MTNRTTLISTGGALEAALAPARSLPPGVLVAGVYRIERRLGEGRVGPVMLARHTETDEPVAVKFMRPQLDSTEGASWFLREARAAARIQSDCVGRVSDSGALDGSAYLIMEFLEGQTFEGLFEKRRRLPVQLLVSYALQAIEGLAEAHSLGIVHRDLKPSNLFLARGAAGPARVKVVDFGIAMSVYGPGDSIELSGASSPRFGSPRWMAPEQIRSSGEADRRSDLWSLGAVLYEALAGRSPFGDGTVPEVSARVLNDDATPLRAIRPDVPETLEAAVMQCLQKDPRRRFKNAGALARALAAGGTAAARKRAERIARIGARQEALEQEASADDLTPDGSAVAIVPHVSLTQTSYGRALAGIGQIVNGSPEQVAPPRPAPAAPSTVEPVAIALQPTETPASFATPWRRSRLRAPAMMPLLVVGAAAAVGLAIFVAGRLRPDAEPSAGTSPASAAPHALEAQTIPSTPPLPAAPLAPLPPTEAPVPAVEPVPGPGPGAASLPPALVPARTSTTPRLKAKSAPAPTPAADAPVGTAGFGGRE